MGQLESVRDKPGDQQVQREHCTAGMFMATAERALDNTIKFHCSIVTHTSSSTSPWPRGGMGKRDISGLMATGHPHTSDHSDSYWPSHLTRLATISTT